MKHKILFGIIFLIVFTIMATACAERTKIVDSEIVNSDLKRNRRLWQESKIVNYNFVITQYRGGSWTWVPVLVKIRNGQPISMEPAREPAEYEKTEGYEDFDTVEKIFDQIQEAYEKEYIVEVVYNKKYGYPEITKINPLTNAHSGFSIEVSKFEIIKTN